MNRIIALRPFADKADFLKRVNQEAINARQHVGQKLLARFQFDRVELPRTRIVDYAREKFGLHIARQLHREPLWVGEGPAAIKRVGWCTGAAQGFINTALDAGLDAYISGEISEPTTHTARECGIHYYAAGHHATERYGVQALGKALVEEFGVTHKFIDCDNPV